MAKLVTDELQDRLNEWCKELDLTSILAVQNTKNDSFYVTINPGDELAEAVVSIVASLYVTCSAEHREEFTESIYDLVDAGLHKGRVWVKNNESK